MLRDDVDPSYAAISCIPTVWEVACRRQKVAPVPGVPAPPPSSLTGLAIALAWEEGCYFGQHGNVAGSLDSHGPGVFHELIAANDRANALLRRAIAVLADIQKLDHAVAEVLEAYSSDAAQRPRPEPERCSAWLAIDSDPSTGCYTTSRVRCNRGKGRHTIVGSGAIGGGPAEILHVASIGQHSEISWRGIAGEE